MSGSVSRRVAAAKALADRVASLTVSRSLSTRWVRQAGVRDGGDSARLQRDRTVIVPWLNRTHPLDGAKICEVGCGTGLSALAMAEQGARVTGIDLVPESVELARQRVAAAGLDASFVVANATDVGLVGAGRSFDWVIFWATLEHMTLDERLRSLSAAWDLLGSGGLLTLIETPNRLWFYDSHTSKLPFFMWLPDELAYRTANESARVGFGDQYGDPGLADLDDFRRRGRGVSYHELDVAIGRPHRNHIVSCLQLERRRRNPLRRFAWRASRAGRYEAILASAAPDIPRCYLQPMLYITIRKP